jgi:hypothetical protein
MRTCLKQLRTFASAVLMVFLASISVATAAKNPKPLTALDYLEIQQLVHRLSFALDYCTNGGEAFADLFVEGGQFIIDEGGGKTRTFGTRQQLITLAGGPDCVSNQSPPRSYLAHLSDSLVIEISADGAHGTSYAIYPSRNGKYFTPDTAGQVGLYHDQYVRTPQGWRFLSRRHEVSPQTGGIAADGSSRQKQ